MLNLHTIYLQELCKEITCGTTVFCTLHNLSFAISIAYSRVEGCGFNYIITTSCMFKTLTLRNVH